MWIPGRVQPVAGTSEGVQSEHDQTELGQAMKGRRGEELPTKSGDLGQETDQEFVKGRQK